MARQTTTGKYKGRTYSGVAQPQEPSAMTKQYRSGISAFNDAGATIRQMGKTKNNKFKTTVVGGTAKS